MNAWAASGGLAIFVGWLLAGAGSVFARHLVTDLAGMLWSGYACLSCYLAGRRRAEQRQGWWWLSVSCAVWLAAATLWAFYELVLGRYAPSPSPADIGFVGYAVPAIIGLGKLSAVSLRRFAVSRIWLDGLVISLAFFVLGWVLVLGPLLRSLQSQPWLVRLDSLAYPVADIVIASVVLVYAMRAGPRSRRVWVLLSGGLVCLAAADTLYVRAVAHGQFHAGTLLDSGWGLAFLLVALAARVSQSETTRVEPARLSVVQESLPFVPVAAALITIGVVRPEFPWSEPTGWVAAAMIAAGCARYLIGIRDHLRLADGLEAVVADRTADLAHRAYHDSLTGMPNRAAFLAALSARMSRLGAEDRCSVLYVDLDGFKAVNDGLGHTAGDRLLHAVGARFAASMRHVDFLARLGGDEFGVIIDDDHPAVPEQVAKRLLDALRDPVPIAGRPVRVGASIGIATTGPTAETGEDLLRNADLAMYLAKARGGAGYQQYHDLSYQDALVRLDVSNDLQSALLRGEFEVFYQPVARLRTGQFAGAEALLRWRHPTQGLLAPDKFLDFAERSGAIVPIGEWVLEQACRELKQWQTHHTGLQALGVAVNLSGRQLGPALIATVGRCLRSNDLDPGCLTLEITEGVIQSDAAVVSDTLRRLKDLGVWLAIDDFGTGHSSLARLRDYAFDELKIDRQFVRDLEVGDTRFVAAQIALAHALGMQVVAEGVETTTQLRQLRDQGCGQIQGYLLGKPMPAGQIRALLAGDGTVPEAGEAATDHRRFSGEPVAHPTG